MKKLKVLNLYAGIGGNRKFWKDVEVTAVENNVKIASVYQDFFPEDKIIITDAHQYLLEHYKEFDFIWSSPPCPTHSRMRNLNNNCEEAEKKYPDMRLYQEIIFLKHFFKKPFVVENVISYYEPLIKPYESGNHYFWSNFHITKCKTIKRNIRTEIDNKWGFNLQDLDMPKKMKNKMLNNMVYPNLGLFIFNCAFKEKQRTLK